MAENYCIILKKELENKLINLLKRIPFRYLKLKEIEVSKDSSTYISIKIEDTIKRLDILSFSFYTTNKIDVKDIIKRVKEGIPKEYFNIEIYNVSNILNNISTNLSKKEIPDTFTIIKIPYRQLEILVDDTQLFLNLNVDSYQKVLGYFRKFKECPISIDFSEISKFLKRKELITLFLLLSQID